MGLFCDITTFHEDALLPQPQPFTFKKQPPPSPTSNTILDCHRLSLSQPSSSASKIRRLPQKGTTLSSISPHCPPSAPTVIFLTATIFLTTQPATKHQAVLIPKNHLLIQPFLMPLQKPSLLLSANILWSSRPPSPTPLRFQAFPNACLKESP